MNNTLERQIGKQVIVMKGVKQADVMWVGLSFKNADNGELVPPLDPSTNSGMLIREIETECLGVKFHKTNLVRFAPIDSRGKLRYPTRFECSEDFPKLLGEIKEINPKVIFLLGNDVSDFVLGQLGFKSLKVSYDFEVFNWNGRWIAPIYHPSYVMVYKRGEKSLYIRSIKDVIFRFL